MIQRIQSLYLSLTILLSLLFLNGSFLTFINKSGSAIKVTFTGILGDSGTLGIEITERIWPISSIIILIPLVSLITIFLFRNRDIQLLFALTVIILSAAFILLSLYYIFAVSSKYETQILPGVKMFLPVLLLIFSFLAYRGIRKDDNLVKSYDRLR